MAVVTSTETPATDAAAAATATAGTSAETDGGAPDPIAEVAKWKAMSRKHEGEAKANRDAAKRLAEIEDANKTEVQKLADAKTASDTVAATAQNELMRLRVAMRKGLTEAQAKRLVGSTEEEIEADADELLESFGVQKTEPGAGKPTRPKERLRSGAGPADEPSPNQVINDRIRQAAGRTT